MRRSASAAGWLGAVQPPVVLGERPSERESGGGEPASRHPRRLVGTKRPRGGSSVEFFPKVGQFPNTAGAAALIVMDSSEPESEPHATDTSYAVACRAGQRVSLTSGKAMWRECTRRVATAIGPSLLRRTLLAGALASAIVLVMTTSALAAGKPVNVGTPYESGQPAVTVDNGGDAVIAWANTKDLAGASNFVSCS